MNPSLLVSEGFGVIKEALGKIQAEVNAAPDDASIAAIGAYLMDYVRQHPYHAPLLLGEGKTLAGSFGAMEDVARKRQKNGRAVLTDTEAFAIVLAYFGVAVAEPVGTPAAAAPVGLKLELEDLL